VARILLIDDSQVGERLDMARGTVIKRMQEYGLK
jgi:hypothetical protein